MIGRPQGVGKDRAGLTVADDGRPGASVVDPAHGLVALRPSSVLPRHRD